MRETFFNNKYLESDWMFDESEFLKELSADSVRFTGQLTASKFPIEKKVR
jgi:hypothetical protein